MELKVDVHRNFAESTRMRRSRPLLGILLAGALLAVSTALAFAQQQPLPWSQRMAGSAIQRWPNGQFGDRPSHWNYALGTLLNGMDAIWRDTADSKYYTYIKSSMDELVSPDGSMPTYKMDEYQLDNVLLGRQLLLLFATTQDRKYYTAASTLYQQLQKQPRNPLGGFWHKQFYPNQMWLDGLYMAEPFYAEYAKEFHHPEDFSDITKQFVLIEEHTHDPKTGLLYHGWDQSKKQRWANRATGDSSQFWGRGMGWYMMALVDTLPYYPESDPGRKQLLAILNREATAIVGVQDPSSGLWYEVLDRIHGKGNYPEASASCMFVYALARGVRLGYLPERYLADAQRGYQGILNQFVKMEPDGSVSLTGTVAGAGLGRGPEGQPYRSGTYEYYVNDETDANDPKGVGAFLLAASEMETANNAKLGRGMTVMMDGWFNSQTRVDVTGNRILYHYKWNEQTNNGDSFFGHMFHQFG